MDPKLTSELVGMMDADQTALQTHFDSGELPTDAYHPEIKALHEQHAARLKAIIQNHGWPGISLVGKEGAKAAWLIAQHSVSDTDFMAACVSLLEAAVAADDVEGWQLAFLQDRVLTFEGQPQLYGTQFDVDDEGWPVSFPIQNVDTVNQRRAALGLNTLEERLAEMIERERQRRANIESTLTD